MNDIDHGEFFISFLINQLINENQPFKMQLVHSKEVPFYNWTKFSKQENFENTEIENLCQNNDKELFSHNFPIHFVYDKKIANVYFIYILINIINI